MSAELARNGHLEIAGRLQLVEVFLAKAVVAIVAGRPLAAGLQEGLRDERSSRNRHRASVLTRERRATIEQGSPE
jgi:hypothetical protein